MYQLSTVLGSLVSLLAGTIDFLYKEASHTSHRVSESLSRAPDSPRTAPALIGRNRSRDYAARRHDLGSRHATHLRAQLEP